MRPYALPSMSLRFVPVWRRNLLVWRKLAGASILGNLADPLIYVLGLGYGLGSMLPQVLLSLWALAVVVLVGLAFGALALTMTALARSYDFFTYYFTLVVTPMNLLCGVFFPIEQLPAAFQAIAALLPLTHAVELARPLLFGEIPRHIVLHIAVLLAYTAAGFYAASVLFRRRLLK